MDNTRAPSIALVAGAAGGIGRETALAWVQREWTVYLGAR